MQFFTSIKEHYPLCQQIQLLTSRAVENFTIFLNTCMLIFVEFDSPEFCNMKTALNVNVSEANILIDTVYIMPGVPIATLTSYVTRYILVYSPLDA